MLQRNVAASGPSERLRSLAVDLDQAAATEPSQAAPGDVFGEFELETDPERREPQTRASVARKGPEDPRINAR